jgi:hypothetical protein
VGIAARAAAATVRTAAPSGARVAHGIGARRRGGGAACEARRRRAARLLPLLGRCGNDDAADAANHAGGAVLQDARRRERERVRGEAET